MEFDYSPLWISLKTVLTATCITFFLGIFIAWRMSNYKGKLKGILDVIFTLPMVLPPTVVGFFLLLILGKNGMFGMLFKYFNTNIIFSWYATVISAVIVSFPLMYKTTRGSFEQIDINILNAARTLGVPELRIFWKITVPISFPGIAAGTVLSFARALGEFGATLMIAGNIPGKTQTIPLAIFFAAEGGNMNRAFIWVCIILIISLIVMTLTNYWTQNHKRFKLYKF
ncbi:MAG: molybdate ABC transporter permease subunit [Clostridiales bacterium]